MRKYIAETVGTFALVFCGTGAIIINHESGGVITNLGIASTFGLIVMAMIYTFGYVSGAHFNPAVTVSFWAAKMFPGNKVLPYTLSQIAGALAASIILKLLFPINETLGATLPAGSELQSFILEVILTFLLMLVIIHVSSGASEKGVMAGIAIGATVGLEAMFAGPICGASMNPARSLAPAIVSGHLEHLYIYLTAPFIGALLSIVVWHFTKETSIKATSEL